MHSPKWSAIVSRLDYTGIVASLFGGVLLPTYCGFACKEAAQRQFMWIAIDFVAYTLVFILMMAPCMDKPRL